MMDTIFVTENVKGMNFGFIQYCNAIKFEANMILLLVFVRLITRDCPSGKLSSKRIVDAWIAPIIRKL